MRTRAKGPGPRFGPRDPGELWSHKGVKWVFGLGAGFHARLSQQRLQAAQGEDQCWPLDGLKDGCLALYEREKAEGTELPAIVGA